MPMNIYHRKYCASTKWARQVEGALLPWALEGVDLGDDVLEVGPGYGATTRLLSGRVPKLTALEVDERLAARLHARIGGPATAVTVVHGDGTAMPFADDRFTSVVCFTMLHHVASPQAQDRLFAEAYRVLRPGGVFAGSDTQPSLSIRLVHLGGPMVAVDPATLPGRLAAAGFTDTRIEVRRSLRFRARKPFEEEDVR